jgi:DNA-binding transcriptional regulator YiaG
MPPSELIGSLAVLGLNKSEAARFLGVTYRTVHRWTEGEQEIPRAVALALRLMIKHGEKPEEWK